MSLRFTSPIVEIDPREVEWNAILDSDSAMREWASGFKHGSLMVRASTYSGREIHRSQEVGSWVSAYDTPAYQNGNSIRQDMRRPVVIAGARRVMVARHSYTEPHIANGYCVEVAKRFMRRSRYTCSDKSKHRDNMDQLATALRRRHHCSYVFDLRSREFFVGPAYDGAAYAGKWVDGRHVEFPIAVAKPPAQRKQQIRSQARRSSYEPRTRRTDERAILRAVYELGLVKEGDTL